MAGLLAHHDRVVHEAFVSNGERVFSTAGDGFGVVFGAVTGAVACALAVQDVLAQDPLRVRIGIHVGEALERDGNHPTSLSPTGSSVRTTTSHRSSNWCAPMAW